MKGENSMTEFLKNNIYQKSVDIMGTDLYGICIIGDIKTYNKPEPGRVDKKSLNAYMYVFNNNLSFEQKTIYNNGKYLYIKHQGKQIDITRYIQYL